MFKFISIIIFTLLFVSKANSEVVNNIEVINNERISKETILIFSKIDIGKDYSQNDLYNIIEDLFYGNDRSLLNKDHLIFQIHFLKIKAEKFDHWLVVRILF